MHERRSQVGFFCPNCDRCIYLATGNSAFFANRAHSANRTICCVFVGICISGCKIKLNRLPSPWRESARPLQLDKINRQNPCFEIGQYGNGGIIAHLNIQSDRSV